jgi:hypothetical protein
MSITLGMLSYTCNIRLQQHLLHEDTLKYEQETMTSNNNVSMQMTDSKQKCTRGQAKIIHVSKKDMPGYMKQGRILIAKMG